LTNIIDKIPRWKLSTATLMENLKAEKNPGVKKANKQKTGPKMKERNPFCQGKK